MGKVYFVRTAIFHIYPSVGYRVVYFSQGHTTTSYLINEIQLHTFFLYITHYRGTDSKIGNFMFNQINLTMKKLFVLAALSIAAILPSCSDDYDDTALRGRVDDLEDRVEQLETLCRQLNSDISSLHTLVTASNRTTMSRA